MKPPCFEYYRAGSLADAFDRLNQSDSTTPTLGGQSLLILLRLRLAAPEILVDVSRIPELREVKKIDENTLRIGAATTHAAIEDQRVPDVTQGLMPSAASGIAYRAVRNLGTIGGSLSLSDPSADWPLCLLALGAHIEIANESATRLVPMDEFLVSAFTTAIEEHELLTAVQVPVLPAGTRWGYTKLARKHGAFADSLAAVILPPAAAPRVALGATTDRPILLQRTAQILEDSPSISESDLRPILAEDVAEAEPDADSYRTRCHLATLLKAIRQAREISC